MVARATQISGTKPPAAAVVAGIGLTIVLAWLGFTQREQLPLRERAERAYQNNDWAVAADAYRDLLKTPEAGPDTHFFLAYSLERSGQFAEAEAAYLAAVRAGTDRQTTLLRMGAVQIQANRRDEAIKTLDEVVRAGGTPYQSVMSDPRWNFLAQHDRGREVLDRLRIQSGNADGFKRVAFLAGEWTVSFRGGATPGTVSYVVDGNTIIERFDHPESPGFTSRFDFDPATGIWRYSAISERGWYREGTLEPATDGFILHCVMTEPFGFEDVVRIVYRTTVGGELERWIEFSAEDPTLWRPGVAMRMTRRMPDVAAF